MNRPIRRLALALFVGLLLLLVNITFIQVVRGPSYRDDARNPRVLIARSAKERGTIVDRAGQILARSSQNALDQTFVRQYPIGADAVHAVGFSSLLFGDRGLEQAYAGELRSKEDITVSDMVSALLGRDLRPQNLVSTIDVEVQRAASAALGDQTGAVVALDPLTGAVLAYVSHPDYNPARLLDDQAGPAGDTLEANPGQPLLDRVVSATYPPGSTFKIITAAAALENNVATPTTRFDNPIEFQLPGSTATIRNFDRGTCTGGADVELSVAFALSCNTVFADLGIQVGADALVAQAELFGFRQPIPFVYDVAPSSIPTADGFINNEAALGQSAIGQRDVRATPLQMAQVVAAIANDGVMMVPYLVSETVDADGQTLEMTQPTEQGRAITQATADTLAELMMSVVRSGTGSNAAVDGLVVSGKTGTAEVGSGAPDVWFIGFADDGASKLAVAVLVEDGGTIGLDATGGAVAAPIARAVFEAWASQ